MPDFFPISRGGGARKNSGHVRKGEVHRTVLVFLSHRHNVLKRKNFILSDYFVREGEGSQFVRAQAYNFFNIDLFYFVISL